MTTLAEDSPVSNTSPDEGPVGPSTVVARAGDSVVADVGVLPLADGSGVVWGLASDQLNANLVKLDAGSSMPAHVNDEVDVLLVIQSGEGSVLIDSATHALAAEHVVLVPRGAARSIHASSQLVYYSIHQRRRGPAIGSAARD